MREQLENMLIAKQVSPTAMRLLVLDYLLDKRTAVTLADLENGVEHSDRITLYRTLKTFEKKGLIHAIKDGPVTKYAMCYEDCTADRHTDAHLHYYCTSCKETFCIPQVSIPEVKLPDDFKLAELSLVARGICGACNK